MKKVKKIYFFIILLFIILNSPWVNNTWAFLDSDLWLDLYKNLDKWLDKFEQSQYIYELESADKKDISQQINKILKQKGIEECIKSWISPEAIDKISKWEIQILLDNIKKEEKCWYKSETGSFDSLNSKKIWELISEISKIKEKYQNKAEQKAKAIHEISRIWMYSDWNTDNSPFDIIADIEKIDKIIFTQEIEYKWEETSFLNELAKEMLKNSRYGIKKQNKSQSNQKKDKEKLNSSIIKTWNLIDKENINNPNNLNDEQYINLTKDPNSYACSEKINKSWLSEESLKAIKQSLDWNENTNINFEYSNWQIKLPSTNKMNVGQAQYSINLNSNNYFKLNTNPYSKVNDNSSWGCNNFFCITINFVVNTNKALWYASSKSIENILETSNKHLKKSANTSLVQSKMATNNFEMSLRDLDLPSIFHMWFIITKKSPPILNLENITQKESQMPKNKADETKIKILLREKYKNLWLDYDKQNDINKFLRKEEELLSIIHSLENPISSAEDLVNEYKKIVEIQSKVNDYDKLSKTKEINNDIIKNFDIEFTELEQFTSNLLDYANNIDKLVKKLKEIPTYSW